jgi:2-polyprenyl-3-methyl-5-hydroxy-6-metoxy-1,4-benzoquinol methylase
MISTPILSPLTHSDNVIPLKKIDCQYISKIYRDRFDIDVTQYFKDLDYVEIYTCLDTGYQFYYPFGLEGDNLFYQALQDFPWYYLEWKWEFDIASKLINSSDRVLEIGCGRSAFIQKIAERRIDCIGLELNSEAVRLSIQKGLNVFNRSIESHSQDYSDYYDIVCSFQVLEHVTEVSSFIHSAIQSLKIGGRLIISVPNNQTFIKHDDEFVLNMPPHHAGLWSPNSLRNLQTVFPLKLEQLSFEPLQAESCSWYYDVQVRRMRKSVRLIPMLNKLTSRLAVILIKPGIGLVKRFRHKIHSHSMLAVYTRIS